MNNNFWKFKTTSIILTISTFSMDAHLKRINMKDDKKYFKMEENVNNSVNANRGHSLPGLPML